MIAALVEIEKHTEGVTWRGMDLIGPVMFSDDEGETFTKPPSPAAEAWMQFRRGSNKGTVLASFHTSPTETQLPIISQGVDGNWEFVVPPVSRIEFPAVAGEYHWAFMVKDEDGIVWPLYYGILEVESTPTSSAEMDVEPEPTPP